MQILQRRNMIRQQSHCGGRLSLLQKNIDADPDAADVGTPVVLSDFTEIRKGGAQKGRGQLSAILLRQSFLSKRAEASVDAELRRQAAAEVQVGGMQLPGLCQQFFNGKH